MTQCKDKLDRKEVWCKTKLERKPSFEQNVVKLYTQVNSCKELLYMVYEIIVYKIKECVVYCTRTDADIYLKVHTKYLSKVVYNKDSDTTSNNAKEVNNNQRKCFTNYRSNYHESTI